MLKVVASLAVLFCLQDGKIDNPQYTFWKSFKTGSTVSWKMESEHAGQKMCLEITITLKAIDDKEVTLENRSSMDMGGKKHDMPAKEQKHPAKTEKNEMGKLVKEGDEEIEVAGKKLKCKWQDYEKEKDQYRVWLSDEIPGRVAKMEGTQRGSKMTLTVTAYEAK